MATANAGVPSYKVCTIYNGFVGETLTAELQFCSVLHSLTFRLIVQFNIIKSTIVYRRRFLLVAPGFAQCGRKRSILIGDRRGRY